ncbi:DNA polymerase III subunit chi [Rhodovulum sp. DZ06]|uniref:DNA polymerase III subunit chi n=1 Tax=Rhodovulum sp. DZ06 TaxID=3425126 RepID=UPI003D341B69
MGEIRFYHLTETGLERALPQLLQVSLSRGWNVCVRFGSEERAAWMNGHLWTFSDESFLPHGGPGDPNPEAQPVYLTAGAETPNSPYALMIADGADATVEELGKYELACVLFDARDGAAMQAARVKWKEVTGAGLKAVYWKQDGGKWTKAAESG